MKPTMKFDEEANALYIKLRNGKIDQAVPFDDWEHGIDIYVDSDEKDNVIGIEILL